MSSKEGQSSRSYRTATVQDDSDDEDLDDLDDVLAAFDSKKATGAQRSATASSEGGPSRLNPPAPPKSEDDLGEDDFEASLAGEMEELLRQLAGTHIPGPMPDETNDQPSSTATALPTGSSGRLGDLSPAEEEAAWQKAIEMMLSGEGMKALGIERPPGTGSGKATQSNAAASPSTSTSRQSAPSATATGGQPAKPKAPSFDETIRRTMEQLNSKDKGKAAATGGGDGVPPDLAALLAKLSAEGLGEDGEDDDLGGLLDGMMSQLMTKEVLEEPMAELASKYPDYLANPPSDVSAADLDKYRQQHKLVDQIVAIFRKPGYSDETDGKEIARLVSEMQDLGGPPKEIMGDLPEGLDLAGLGGDEACTIM